MGRCGNRAETCIGWSGSDEVDIHEFWWLNINAAMTVKFQWLGAIETESGRAVYEIGSSTYDLWLPNFSRALQIDQVLRDVYEQGRRCGHAEMLRAASVAMSETARNL